MVQAAEAAHWRSWFTKLTAYARASNYSRIKNLRSFEAVPSKIALKVDTSAAQHFLVGYARANPVEVLARAK